ncbi:hotdog fold thioesterase [Aurantimonas endophytica]|nr:hotdog fold thioesterase [Aurantimonas endophytica]
MPVQPIMTVAEINRFLETDFPQLGGKDGGYLVVDVAPGTAVLRLLAGSQHLRPGGTVSGPTLFALADVAAYVAILAHIGPVALAVTTNLSINFLRKPEPGALFGRARILKLGKRLAVVEVAITPDDEADTVAHAVATYSIPPRPTDATDLPGTLIP